MFKIGLNISQVSLFYIYSYDIPYSFSWGRDKYGSAQNLLLALCSMIIPVDSEDYMECLWLNICQLHVRQMPYLLAVLLLQLLHSSFKESSVKYHLILSNDLILNFILSSLVSDQGDISDNFFYIVQRDCLESLLSFEAGMLMVVPVVYTC